MSNTAADPEDILDPQADRGKAWPAVSRVWLVAGGGWAGRATQVLCQLVSVRILTDSLGTSGYGVFAVLASLTGWFALSDLCIAASLQNHISRRRATGEAADDIVLTAALLALGACCTAAVLLFAIGPWLADMLLNQFDFLSSDQRTLAFYAMTFPGIGTALGGVMYKIWLAHHRGYLASLLPAAGTLLGTIAVWSVARMDAQPILPWSVAVFYAPLAILPILLLGATVVRAMRHHRFNAGLAGPILHHAFRFWIFGLLSNGVLQVDYIIMARVLEPDDIVVYSIATRLFGLVFFVYTAILTALWPVCSEYIFQSNWKAALSTAYRYIAIGIVFVIGCGTVILFTSDMIVAIISPSLAVALPVSIIALLTIYYVVRIWTDTFGMLLQSMNDLSIFWIVVPFQSLLSIALQVLGARMFGLPGMLAGLILCFVATVAWVLPRRCLSHARAAANHG